MYWLDDSRLIYNYYKRGEPHKILVINPFDGTTNEWQGVMGADALYVRAIYPWESPTQYPAPDFTLSLVDWLWDQPKGLYEIASYVLISEMNFTIGPFIKWMPDSSHFVATVTNSSQYESPQLALFDRNGSVVDVVLALSENQSIDRITSAWSYNGRFLAFKIVNDWDHTAARLYIADLQERQIINTCLQIGEGTAFSPDNTQLAILEPGKGTKYVMVLDLESWGLYPVANHIVDWYGSVIGWREN